MPKFNVEYFIAHRIASSGGSDSRNVMVRIATLTVAIGMASMIVALAVISGFRHEITAKLVGFSSHIQITGLSGNHSLETDPITVDQSLERRLSAMDGFASLHTYAVKAGILKTDEAIQGVMLKGVDPAFDWGFFRSNLIVGELPRVGDSVRNKDILIARSLADMMAIGVDDRVEMLFISGDTPPRRDRFRVTGIYDSGMDEMEKMVVLTDIRNVRRLNNWDDEQVTGYEVSVSGLDRLPGYYDQVRLLLLSEPFVGSNLIARDLHGRYPGLYDWLKTHDVNGAVIIIIMLVVALLNMASAMLIILLERTSMIGLLKALGMSNRSVQKVFVIRSSFIVLRGMLWGNAAGIGLCLFQKWTGAVKLDEAGYFLSEVPIRFDWWRIAGLNLGAFVFIVLLLTLPTMIVSSVKPEKTIRYQ